WGKVSEANLLMLRRIALLPILLTVIAYAQQEKLGGVGGAGGIAGYQTSATVFTITTTSLPNAVANAAYSQTLTAVNGVSPLLWSVAFGSLPPGLTLNSSTGTISGTPTVVANYTFTILVVDSSSPTAKQATQQLTIQVTCAPLQITTQSPLPPGVVGSTYNDQ